MSATRRRSLRVDDPLGAGDEHPDGGLPSGERADAGRLRDIALGDIHANPQQPRKRFEDGALTALADSIRERGVLQPIIVRPSDLTPIEQARTLAVLLDDLRVTGNVLGRRLGRSRADIVNTVRLLDLPDEAIDLIDSGALSKGHGKALLAEPDHHRRRSLARRAAEGGWSVRALEAEIARVARPAAPRRPPHPDQCAAAARLQDVIATATGCEAKAMPHRRGIQIILDQAAADRLERVLEGEVAGL